MSKKLNKDVEPQLVPRLNSDADMVWMCPICDEEAVHIGYHWIHCKTHGMLQTEADRHKLVKTVTGTFCVWCDHVLDKTKVKNEMATCPKCKVVVDVKHMTVKLDGTKS